MKYLSVNEGAQEDFVTRGQLIPNLKSMALSTDKFLSANAPSIAMWPVNRSVYCDIVDGFGGDTNAALGIDKTDKIGGRVRPHYHTFQNSWLNAMNTKAEELYALKDKSHIKTELAAYKSTLQGYLDQSNASAGISRN